MRGALALICLLALPAWPQGMSEAPGPATQSPSNGNCGFSGLFGLNDLHGQLEAIYADVFILSGISGRRPAVVYQQTAGTKIARLQRAGGRADSAEFEVVVFQRLCDLAHSPDEVAFVFAHELGHYAKGHIPMLESAFQAATVDCAQSGGTCAREKIKPFQVGLEGEADSYAVETLSKPGSRYRAMSGADAMEHYKDLRWAVGTDNAPDPTHASTTERAEAIRAKLSSLSR